MVGDEVGFGGVAVGAWVDMGTGVAVGDGAAQATTAPKSSNVTRVILSMVCKGKENRWNMLSSLCAR
jgi:hypothetical protein